MFQSAQYSVANWIVLIYFFVFFLCNNNKNIIEASLNANANSNKNAHLLDNNTPFLTTSPNCPDQTDSDKTYNVDFGFETNILQNEFIVHFYNYYWAATRRKFIIAALQKSNITGWHLIPRLNLASNYPSDFDTIKLLESSNVAIAIENLKLHPAVRSVTPHRGVKRTLKYVTINNTVYHGIRIKRNSWYIGRQLQRSIPRHITTALQADELWRRGITGKGIKVGVFDTGLSRNHPHFRHVKERTNWTNEKSLDDGVSHGTFVAGVIASSRECLGFAPDAELHIYRVFTNSQVSYTSWFMDAFNYAIFRKINILNLSIGGPDFLDHPFVDKVLELSANRVIMVSAIGNDGPLYGTLNNPGDQSDVIGVGGINFDDKVAKFSSRGMTTWELPSGYGRLKPDIVTYGNQVKGSNIHSGCRTLSGTSVASPVVAGAITLIASGALNKSHLINPASMKQILIEGSQRLSENNMFEQGHGKLDIIRSMQLLLDYVPKVTLTPAYLDFAESYMWPYNSQPLFCDSMPIIVNVTILNGVGVTGKVVGPPTWHSYADENGHLLNVAISYLPVLWPWSGWMAVHLAVKQNGCNFKGTARGHISITIQNETNSFKESRTNNYTVNFPINVNIIPRPPRHKRILWDQYHNLRYPPGYIPRDNLKTKSDPLDWRGDHIHTNFRDMYNHLRNLGYYIDVLRMPYTCFNATHYGTLLIVDPEEEFFDDEKLKVQNDVYNHALSVIIFADWYNTTVMKKIKFFDENTRQWWIPDTGGSNIPALNEFLKPFGVAFSDIVAEGHFKFGDHEMYYASGATIAKYPKNVHDIIIGADLNDQGLEFIENAAATSKHFLPILGLIQTKMKYLKNYISENVHLSPSSYEENKLDPSDLGTELSPDKNPLLNKRILLNSINMEMEQPELDGNKNSQIDVKNEQKSNSKMEKTQNSRGIQLEGRIAIYGDSNCLDSTYLGKACFWLLDALLEFTMSSHISKQLKKLNRAFQFDGYSNKTLPLRISTSNLHKYSKVLDSKIKFKKRKTEQCEHMEWSDGIMVNSIDEKVLIGKNEGMKDGRH